MKNHLTHIKEFKAALSNFHVSDESKRLLGQVKVVLLTAPTSTGRNTIIRELVKKGDYYFLVSDTTRQPRINDGVLERDGVEYWFRTEEDVLNDISVGKFLEAAIIHEQHVSGVSVREVENALKQNKIAITEITIDGINTIRSAKPDTITFFVLPPSFTEWQQRLHSRGTMPPDEVRRRMESSVKEFEAALQGDFYTFVINDTIENATRRIDQIAKQGVTDHAYQATCRALAKDLYEATRRFLKSQ